MILRRLADAVRRQDWFTVVIEFVIVVAGIYVGIEVSNWNETRQEHNLEQLYLQELAEDFATNLDELEGSIETVTELIDDLLFLLEADQADPAPSPAELNEHFKAVQRMPTFTTTSRTYANLIGSGDLKLITSRSIQKALAGYQRKVDLVEVVQQTHEQELVVTFQPYIIEHMDYAAVALDRSEGEFSLPPPRDPARIVELLSDRTFRNILIQKYVISTDLLNQFRQLRAYTQKLVEDLGAAISKG